MLNCVVCTQFDQWIWVLIHSSCTKNLFSLSAFSASLSPPTFSLCSISSRDTFSDSKEMTGLRKTIQTNRRFLLQKTVLKIRFLLSQKQSCNRGYTQGSNPNKKTMNFLMGLTKNRHPSSLSNSSFQLLKNSIGAGKKMGVLSALKQPRIQASLSTSSRLSSVLVTPLKNQR